MIKNKFEFATRNKLRFDSTRGLLSVEQLWDLPLRSKDGFDLDGVAKQVNKKLKDLTEESFVQIERSPAQDSAEIALELVKYIISVKLAEEDEAKVRAANREKKQQLLRILAEKQEGALSELSVRELQKQIDALKT
jgi:hypothetical protein